MHRLLVAPLLPRLCPALVRLLVIVGTALSALLLTAAGALATGSPVFGPPPPDGGDPNPTWTWTDGGDTTMVRVDCTLTYSSTGAVVASAPSCGWSYTADLAGKATGSYTLTLIGYDAAGVAGPPASQSITYTGPAAPVITSSPTPSPGRETTVSWSYTHTTGHSPVCTLSYAGTVVQTVASCPATVSFTLASGDGTYTFAVSTFNSPTTTSSYVLDTTAPPAAQLLETFTLAAPSVTGPSGPSSDRHPVYELSTTEQGVSWHCEVTGPLGTVIPSCSAGTWSYPLDGQPDGTYVGRIWITKDSRTSPVTEVSYILDTKPPLAPTVTGAGGPSNNRTPTVTLTGEPGGAWECRLTSPSGVVTTPVCAAGDVTLSLTGPDGSWSLSVVQVDAAGNRSPAGSWSYLLDTTAPATPTVTGPSGPSSSRTPTVTLAGEAGGSWECRLTSPSEVVTTPTCAAGQRVLDLIGPDGTWSLSVVQVDAAGNRSAPASWTYLLDTTAPAAPTATGPAGPTSSSTVLVELVGEPGSTWSCRLHAPDGRSTLVPCASGQLELDLTGPDGAYELVVRTADEAGNTSEASTYRIVRDTQAPAAPRVSPVPGADGEWSLETEPGASLACTLVAPDGVARAVACEPGVLSVELNQLAPGPWTLVVRARDAAGNEGEPTRADFTVDHPPQSPSPVEAPAPVPVAVPLPAPPPVLVPAPAPVTVPLPAPPPVLVPAPVPAAVPVPARVPVPTGAPVPVRPVGVPSPVSAPLSVGAPPSVVTSEPSPPLPDAQPSPPEGPPRDAPPVLALPQAAAALAGALPAVPDTVGTVVRLAVGEASARAFQRLRAPNGLDSRWRAVLRVVDAAAAVGGIPLLLMMLVLLFLALQDRIDRNDPKLALAPVHSHQALPFRPLGRPA